VNGVLQSSLSKWYETKSLNEAQKQYLSEQINNVPMISKGIFSDVIRNLEDKHHKMDLLLHATNQQINKLNNEVRENYSSLAVIKSNTDQLISKSTLEQYSSSYKGAEGQNNVYDMLADKLLAKDGYELKPIHGVMHSTDIIVTRVSFPTVRIEVKNYAKNEKVRTKEIDKFRRDLMETDNHGIIVSLHSLMVGRSEFLELEQLSNGKFAIYIPNNEYNMEIIIDMLHLIYKLDNITRQSDESAHLQISTENMVRLENYLKDFALRINTVKNQLKQSISVLNEITFDAITTLLINQKRENEQKFKCENCGLALTKKSSYTNHIKTCKKEVKVDEVIEDKVEEIKSDENVVKERKFPPLKKVKRKKVVEEDINPTTPHSDEHISDLEK